MPSPSHLSLFGNFKKIVGVKGGSKRHLVLILKALAQKCLETDLKIIANSSIQQFVLVLRLYMNFACEM